MIIVLKCIDCENQNCKCANKYIPSDSQAGCWRDVDENLYVQYTHAILEEWSFISQYNYNTIKNLYMQIQNILLRVYDSKCVKIVDHKGKSLKSNFKK